MKQFWNWIKEWPALVIIIVVGLLLYISLGFVLVNWYLGQPTPPKTAYTTRADCTHAMELHAAEVDRLHDRNERNLIELIIVREQLKIMDSIRMDGFVETTSQP